jgi:hypothetical protein
MENENLTGEDLISREEPGKDNNEATAVTEASGDNMFSKIFPENRKLAAILHTIAITLLILFSLFTLFVFFVFAAPSLSEMRLGRKTLITSSETLKKDPAYKKQIAQLNREIQRLSRKYNSYTSGQSYLVINTTDNLFYLYRNKKLVREGHCSTGSFKLLKTQEGKSWVFKTPKGKFTIQGKQTNPVWTRPDWAYVEEGLPIPPQDDPSRYEPYVLGDYKLALGGGYLIHGTIYKRLLGMPVTHGCVRLGDEDLKVIFNTLSIGSKVYIF